MNIIICNHPRLNPLRNIQPRQTIILFIENLIRSRLSNRYGLRVWFKSYRIIITNRLIRPHLIVVERLTVRVDCFDLCVIVVFIIREKYLFDNHRIEGIVMMRCCFFSLAVQRITL